MKIFVISPHLDDAALNVCDHIKLWQSEGHDISVITIFTSFRSTRISDDARKYTGIESDTTQQFGLLRKQEDVLAMKMMGVHWSHLGYVDAGFRMNQNTSVYPDFAKVFSGKLSELDESVILKLTRQLKTLLSNATCVVPLGIGRHVDHVLAKQVVEQIVAPRKIWYYVDYPYALQVRGWTLAAGITACRRKRSILNMSTRKNEILACYTSQMPRLFPQRVRYSEMVLR